MSKHEIIIAVGPTCPGDRASLPARAVLRRLGREFVVHTEVFDRDGTSRGYCHGHYTKCPQEALEQFCEKLKRVGAGGIEYVDRVGRIFNFG